MNTLAAEIRRQANALTVRRLPSGYVHLRGIGPHNWAQPPWWPCGEEMLRAHAFGQASEAFISACLEAADGSEAVGR